MTTWAEIRELASKLKATQDGNSVQNLSERTWVDIVKHLTNTNRLKLYFTTDGRSYLTKYELEKEIREEVEAHNGRVSLSEIASNLDIDPLLVEVKISEMIASNAQVKHEDRLICIPGEIVNESYVRQVAHEIQDRLEERGQLTIGELATVFCLPTAFLLNLINQYQGILFRVQKYGEKYITDMCMAENKARVRGYFTAVMRPVTLCSVASKLGLPETLLSSIVSSLINSGHLCGALIASRGTYVPSCYTQAEDSYVNAFFAQNGYVEWSYLKRLGVADPGAYLRSLLPNATHLSGVSVGSVITDQLKVVVEDTVNECTWADLAHCIPVSLTSKERMEIIAPHLKGLPLKLVADGLFIISDQFITKCEPYFDKFIRDRAELASKEERRIAVPAHSVSTSSQDHSSKRSTSAIKGGFGMGAREIKTKNVKKKYQPSKRRMISNHLGDSDNEEAAGFNSSSADSAFVKYITIDDLTTVLASSLPADVPEDVHSGIVEILIPQLKCTFAKIYDSIFLPNSETARRRETVVQTQEAVQNMLVAIQLMERGILSIDQPSLQTQLLRHLVKNHGACLVDRLCAHLAQYYDIAWPTSAKPVPFAEGDKDVCEHTVPKEMDFLTPLNAEQRYQLVDLLKRYGSNDAVQAALVLQELLEKMRAIQSSNVGLSDYYSSVEKLATSHIGLSLSVLNPRTDNKRKREERAKANELAVQFENQLHEALDNWDYNSCINAAATATLAAACLFAQVVTGWPVTAPGKCVPELISWLSDFVHSKRQQTPGRGQPSSLSAAIQLLVTSSAVDNLSSLTRRITEHMRSQIDHSLDSELKQLIEQLVDTAKDCRKLLSA
ncbi:E3 UFM1-protein ligase 1 [Paragonimus heterotremus]|uniref:E3 UFM1-protein ligase 1 n=1 Tax=Paragonimus heterotremus TaxID=100268 RepID=A0A8J4SWD0_9TREM|nr:E3 UFM1-protein ligase 1 [Paragonimus heterotremus]